MWVAVLVDGGSILGLMRLYLVSEARGWVRGGVPDEP